MKTYPEYKDSGIEWIGEIPKHWDCKHLKFLGVIKSGNGFKLELQGDEISSIPFYKVSDTNHVGNEKYLFKSNNYVSGEIVNRENFWLFPKGTIVFPKIGEVLKLNKRRILSIDGCIDNNMMGLTIKTEDSIDYVFTVMTLVSHSQ